MPLNHGYGVAIGTFVSFTRDDPDDFGRWFHGNLTIATPAGQYQSALDVDTPSGAGVSYRIVTGLTSSDLQGLDGLGAGFQPLVSTPTSGALDYLRTPLLRGPLAVHRLRRLGPTWLYYAAPSARPWSPTILDRIIEFVGPSLPQPQFPWIASDGNTTLDVLASLLEDVTRIYIFGEPFTQGRGVHNVHLNQGDPPGSHQAENDIWQDGGVLLQRADGEVTAWQVKFNTQSLDTNDQGLPN